jgi:hypothetical protein
VKSPGDLLHVHVEELLGRGHIKRGTIYSMPKAEYRRGSAVLLLEKGSS